MKREYNVGDKVRIRADLKRGEEYISEPFTKQRFYWVVDPVMYPRRGEIGVITEKDYTFGCYLIAFGNGGPVKFWTSEMFEPLEDEELVVNDDDSDIIGLLGF